MSEQTMIDPLALNINVNDVETGRPCIADGTEATLECVEAVVEQNKAKVGFNLKLIYQTVEELPNSKGTGSIAPGYILFKWLPLQASPLQVEKAEELRSEGKASEANASLNRFKEDIAATIDALFGTNKGNRPNLDQSVISQMTGKTARAVIKLRNDDKYGPGNEIGYYKTT